MLRAKYSDRLYSLHDALISSAVGIICAFLILFLVVRVLNLTLLQWSVIYGLVSGNMIGLAIGLVNDRIVIPRVNPLPSPLRTLIKSILYIVTSIAAILLFFLLFNLLGLMYPARPPIQTLLWISGFVGVISLLTALMLGTYEHLKKELQNSYEQLKDKEILERELAMARDVQRSFLPAQTPQVPGYEIATYFQAAKQVGGDYYCLRTTDNILTIAIGDVSGKGMPAALIMANLHATLQALDTGTALDELIAKVNNTIHRNTAPEAFVTFFYGQLDSATGEFRYVNAGHEQPILIRSAGFQEYLSHGGMIVGAVPDMTYQIGQIQLETDDLLFLCTDGVTEAGLPHIEPWASDHLLSHLQAQRQSPAEQILSSTLAQVQKSTAGLEQTDDIAMILLKRIG